MKVREYPGQFVKNPLNDGYNTYARIIEGKFYAFYDGRKKESLPLIDISNLPVAFIIPVHMNGVKSGRWQIIGGLPLEEKFKTAPAFFIQDPLDSSVFRIYKNGQMYKSSLEECIGLERFMVWDFEYVESRLMDHYAGKPNVWVELSKIKI